MNISAEYFVRLLSGLNRIDFPTSRKVDAVDPSG